MSTSPPPRSWLRRWSGRLWWLIDGTRRLVFNLLFLALLVALVFALTRGKGVPALEEKTALVLGWSGPLVEQRSGSSRDSLLSQLGDGPGREVQLRDVLAVLDAAAKDPNISHAVLLLDEFEGAGLASLRDVAAAMKRFRAAGKDIVAWGSAYDQRQYYLAAHASEVLMHPMGQVYIDGYGRYRNYYRDALEKLGVTANLVRAGTYKNAGEPFIATGPSEATLEADKLLYGGLWTTYTSEVEQARGWASGTLARAIENLPADFRAVEGDAGKLALAQKAVDALVTRDELRERLVAKGAPDTSDPLRPTFRQVSFARYLAGLAPASSGSDAIGVVVAAGEISDGNQPPGQIGGLSTAELIRQARHDDKIKALVLRVDSPGGSAFGSELVRRELALTRSAGKPVVVSMGDLAASGGYWISMAADEVMADPATITGSIGVFTLLPSADKALDKLGVATGGSPTTWLGGAGDPRRPLDPRFAELVQASVDRIYADFTQLVATARKKPREEIDRVAQGRVWTGQQALERGLVDRVGGFHDAIAAAAKRAQLAEDAPVRYIEREPSRFSRLSAMFGGALNAVLSEHLALTLVPAGLPTSVLQQGRADLAWLHRLSDGRQPFEVAVHCLCSPA